MFPGSGVFRKDAKQATSLQTVGLLGEGNNDAFSASNILNASRVVDLVGSQSISFVAISSLS